MNNVLNFSAEALRDYAKWQGWQQVPEAVKDTFGTGLAVCPTGVLP